MEEILKSSSFPKVCVCMCVCVSNFSCLPKNQNIDLYHEKKKRRTQYVNIGEWYLTWKSIIFYVNIKKTEIL